MESNETEGQSSVSPSPANVFRLITKDTPKRVIPTRSPDPTLKNGRILPKKLQSKFADLNAWGKPLEEIDPYYERGTTYIVVSSKFRLFRYSTHHSLFLFHPLNTLRRYCVFILTHWIFHAIMTTIVTTNYISYATHSFSPFDEITTEEIAVRYVCQLVYTAEFFLKWIAMGFALSPFTYLRSFWCWLDLTIILGMGIQVFGSVHVLMKIIFYIPGLHMAFDFCISCVSRLKEMLLASVVVLSALSIMGVQLFMGILTQTCVSNFNGTYLNETEQEFHELWHLHTANVSNWYYLEPESAHLLLCGNSSGSGKCPEGYTCLQGRGHSADYGYTNFDSFGWSLLSVLRLVTQDYTELLIQQIVKTASHIHAGYFLLVFFFGTFGLGTFSWGIIVHKFLEMKELKDESESSESQSEPTQIGWFSRLFPSWNFPPGFNSFRRQVHCFMFHPFSEVCITSVIILDILLMISNIEQSIFRQIFCWIYVLEFLAKTFAESHDYFHHPEHILDTIIVVLFIVTLFVPNHFLTSFLVMRMFKLFPRWPSLNFLIQSLLNTLRSYWQFFFLLLIYMLSESLNGATNLHAHNESVTKVIEEDWAQFLPKYPFGLPRWHFQDWQHSFMIIFRIACGEWIETLWDTMLAHGTYAFGYFIPPMLLMILMLMTASVATIVGTAETFTKIEFQENLLYSKFEDGLRRLCFPITWLRSKINPGGQTHNILEEAPIHRESQLMEDPSRDSPLILNRNNAAESNESRIEQIFGSQYYSGISIAIILWCSFVLIFDDVHNQYFPGHLTNLHLQGNETVLSQPSTSKIIIFYSDIIFTIYFGVDVISKLVYFLSKRRFVSSGWIFDVVLLIEMIFSLTVYSPYTSPLRGFFNLKCFRLFMLVSRVERIAAVFSGLIKEISIIWRYVLAGLFILLAFDIQGVQLFSGRFGRCINSEAETISSVIVSHIVECRHDNMTWINAYANFDNVINGIHPLFRTITLNGWIAVIHDAVDSRGVSLVQLGFWTEYEQPERDANYTNVFYLIFVIVFGVFFLFFTLVGILIHYLKTDQLKGIFMTFDQFHDYKNNSRQLEAAKLSPPPESTSERKIPEPNFPVLKFFYRFVEHQFFDKFIMCIIIFQWLIYSLDQYSLYIEPMSSSSYALIAFFSFCHVFVVSIYTIEMMFKLLGWRQHYFKSVFNQFDFFIVIFLVVDIFLSDIVEKYFISPVLFSMVRIFRIFQFEPFKRRGVLSGKYLDSLNLVKPALLNLLLFLLINLFSFSLLFMATFKNVKLRAGLDAMFDFQTFQQSVSLLFQLSTFGGWDTVHETLADNTDCNQSDVEFENDCGSPFKASLMIFSYLSMSVFLVLNIYVVFILEIVKGFTEDRPKVLASDQSGSTSSNNIDPFSAEAADSTFSFDRPNVKILTDSSFT